MQVVFFSGKGELNEHEETLHKDDQDALWTSLWQISYLIVTCVLKFLDS